MNRLRIFIIVVLFAVLPASLLATSTSKTQQSSLQLEPVGHRRIAEGELLSLNLTVTGTDQRPPVFRAEGLPPGAEFDPGQGHFRWIPDFHQAGTFVVTFAVTDGVGNASEDVMIQVENTNRPPQISGQPDPVARVGGIYFFAPTATDPDGGALRFSIEGLPPWASFDQRVGVLSGIPEDKDVGTSEQIVISVSDGLELVSLPPFVIAVVVDPEAADQRIRFDDYDTDGDGVSNRRDGFPFDPTRADWVIGATSGAGGDIHPAGEVSVLYGGSRQFHLTPGAGYYINDLLVNGVSMGLVDRYEFVNISSHHSIHGEFSKIPYGLSQDPLDPGLSGVMRLDGGDDSHNRVDGKPSPSLDYRFHVVLREDGVADAYHVYVVINGSRYPMLLDQGILATGARYAYRTRLGAAVAQRFYFLVEDQQGQLLWRFPATGDLPGPVVELLSGRNLIGIAARVNPFALAPQEVAGDNPLLRWQGDATGGSFTAVTATAPVATGEGYLLYRTQSPVLMDVSGYGQIRRDVHEFAVTPGWNLIANPYPGALFLEEMQVRVGDALPLPWLTAVAQQQVVDGLYSYRGDDWGGGYEFFSATGSNRAMLVPWIGYWIYVNPAQHPVSILIPKPAN